MAQNSPLELMPMLQRRVMKNSALYLLMITFSQAAYSIPPSAAPRDPAIVPRIPEPAPAEIKLPSATYRTLQDAVGAIRPGGTIFLSQGSYYGPTVIDGKHLTIRGLGIDKSDVVLRGGNNVAITLKGKAALTLANVELSSSQVGILGLAGSPLPSVDLSEVMLSGNGIRGHFNNVNVSQTEIVSPGAAGVDLLSFRSFFLQDVSVSQSNGFGIVAASSQICTANLKRIIVNGSVDPGIRLSGAKCDGSLTQVWIENAGGAGIDFDNWKSASLSASIISYTKPNRVGKYGDGLRVRYSQVNAQSIQSNHNSRTGASVFGCSPSLPSMLQLKDSLLLNNDIDINVEKVGGLTEVDLKGRHLLVCEEGGFLMDNGNNWCGANMDTLRGCIAQSGELDPTPP